MLKIVICAFLAGSILPLAGHAYECPPERIDRIGQISYNTADYFATFTLEKYPDKWMALSYSKGVDKSQGRAMTALALAAYTAGLNVSVGYCYEDGRVNRLIVENTIR